MDYETIFVKNFIQNRLQERIIYELKSKKKRVNAISRFCHNTLDTINQDTIFLQSNNITINQTIKSIQNLTNSKFGYIISYDNDIDKQVFSIENSIEKVFYRGMAQIIVFDDKVSFVKEEQSFGSPMKYVLFNDILILI